MNLTEIDLYAIKKGKATHRDMAYKYRVSLQTVYKEVRESGMTENPAQRHHSKAMRQRLKDELLEAIPYDPVYSTTAILARWGLKSLTHALRLLKVKSLDELRGAPADTRGMLKSLGLNMRANVLYSPANRGWYYPERQIHLTPEEHEEFIKNPSEWLKSNADRLKVCYAGKKVKPLIEKRASDALKARFALGECTAAMVARRFTVEEIQHETGSGRYIEKCRKAEKKGIPWWCEIFREQDIELLKKEGLIKGGE